MPINVYNDSMIMKKTAYHFHGKVTRPAARILARLWGGAAKEKYSHEDLYTEGAACISEHYNTRNEQASLPVQLV